MKTPSMINPSVLLLIFCFIILNQALQSQTWQEVRGRGSNYLWGEGTGASLQEADKNALDDLISQISVQVRSSFEQVFTQEGEAFNQSVKSIVETYSSATLTHTKRMVQEERNLVRVLRYIPKGDVDRIFDNRLKKVIDFTQTAIRAEADLRIADALRYYYWAFVLLRSHPENETYRHEISELPPGLMTHVLNDRIVQVLRGVRVLIASVSDNTAEKHRELTLNITYKGQAVENFEYNYWIGSDWTNPVNVNSGNGLAEFFGDGFDKIQELRLRAEYQFRTQSRFDEELRSIMEYTQWLPNFPQCEIRIPIQARMPETSSLPLSNINLKTLNRVNNYQDIQRNISRVIAAIESNDPTTVRNLFTIEGYSIFSLLTQNGRVRILQRPDTLSMVSLNNETIVRSLPMSFSFHNNTRTFTENVVFAFDETGKINSLSFALGDRAVNDIINKGDRFGTTEDRYHIIRFMEDYKTAYSLKRLDFLEAVFAENALIIVGRMLKEDENQKLDGMYGSLNNERVQYIRLNKREYMDRLRMVFAANEFVNIHFEDNDVKRSGSGEKVYGIQIAQHYFSSNYADKGYLFLMIDLQDTLNPRIYVRSWQPEKNPDGSIIGLPDFYFK
jgi:hypothetical protein